MPAWPSHLGWIALVVTFFLASSVIGDVFIPDVTTRVNLFVGTAGNGHAFPGANVPHGMVKVGMDTDSQDNHAGYNADPSVNVLGFSQLHDDGTGGSVPLSNFKIWPFASCGDNDIFEDCPTSSGGRRRMRKLRSDGTPDDAAEPGYFASNLSTDIRVELTSTRRAALHRYTFPANTQFPRLLVDMSNEGAATSSDIVMTIDPITGRVSGGGSFAASFGPGRYRVYMCVDFKGDGFTLGTPTEYGAWISNGAVKNIVDVDQLYLLRSFRDEVGALLTFRPNDEGPTASILARVGVSFISSEQACTNAEHEIPDFDFEGVRSASRAQWRELLGRIQVNPKGVDPEFVDLFYSSLYRTHISPADYSGENPRWSSPEPYYDSFYCNWDTYRTLFSLMALHDPATFSRIVRGMINIQQHEGYIPECRGATVQQYIQGGSNGDPILAEFFVKFQDHAEALGVSADALYNALLADAEKQPANWNLQGRQANIWKQIGYIPFDLFERGGTNTKQVSRALEYAFDDFTISQYAQRAMNFQNLWDANLTFPDRSDIKGFMQQRAQNGTFSFTDPRRCTVHDPSHENCFLIADRHDGFYEGGSIVYSQYVPHDTARLIELQGGNDAFVSRLNFIFEEGYFDSTDEPSQQMPFMYHYANRPGLSTQHSRQVIAEFYNTSVHGLPGNDDSGAMGSYVAFYLLGLYPLPGTRQILLSSPYFPEVSIRNPVLNTTTTILANGFKGNPADGTGGTVFVKSVKIDGVAWKSNCFIEWDVFMRGSLIELELTDDINVPCGTDASALPPSLSTGGYD